MTAAAAEALMYCLLSGRLLEVSVTLFSVQCEVYTQLAINDEPSLLAPTSGKYGPHRLTEYLTSPLSRAPLSHLRFRPVDALRMMRIII